METPCKPTCLQGMRMDGAAHLVADAHGQPAVSWQNRPMRLLRDFLSRSMCMLHA